MEENRNENFTNYEPNFVMKDPEPIAENPSYVTADTVSGEELFGEDRLIQALNSDPDAVPHAQIERVYEAIHAFVKEAPQFDDITMLCIEYKGPDQQGLSVGHSS